MRGISIVILFLSLVLFSQTLAQDTSAQSTKLSQAELEMMLADGLNVAVLDLDLTEGVPEPYRTPLSDRLRQELIQTGRFHVIERNAMEDVLKEQGFQLAGCTSDECAVEVGRMLGVNMMIAGSVGQVGSVHAINLRMIDVETGEIVYAKGVDCKCTIEGVLTTGLRDAATLISGQNLPENPTDGKPSIIPGPLTGMEFAILQGGWFFMGSNEGERRERPINRVIMPPYEIMTTEVTQDVWTQAMHVNPAYHIGDDLPVEGMTINEIEDFIRFLNGIDDKYNYRLPTEEEWEYACRAGSRSEYAFDEVDERLNKYGWFADNSGNETHPVMTKEPNEWGLYDMYGNVMEYCNDIFYESNKGSNYRERESYLYRSNSDAPRSIRGGSFKNAAQHCRSASRAGHYPKIRSDYVGFRLVRFMKK